VVRRLIVNADDFGLTSGVNQAILEAHRHGLVTSSTLMAGGAAFAEAARLAGSTKTLSVGCHVVLTDGSPTLNPRDVPSLLQGPETTQFRTGLSRFALAAMSGRLASEEIEAEVRAQIRRLQTAQVDVTHADTHKHTHMFPQVLQPFLLAAHACGLRAVRNPFEPVLLLSVFEKPRLWKRWLQMKTLSRLGRGFRRAVLDAGLVSPDGTVAILATGRLDERLFRLIVRDLPRGTWELVCHPGYHDAELQGIRTRLRESREQELRVLTTAGSREFLASHGIELISYRDLA
jgi:chitin disaccharide deacetylase